MSKLLTKLKTENRVFDEFYSSNQEDGLNSKLMLADLKKALTHNQTYIDQHMNKLEDVVFQHRPCESDLELLHEANSAQQEYIRLRQEFD